MYFIASLSSGWESIVKLIVVLIVFAIVVVLTGLTTKFVGGYQKSQFSNKNMKPIESMKVGNNKFIQLVKIGEVYLVLGIGKDEVHTIAKLSKDELPDLIEEGQNDGILASGSFQKILTKIINRNGKDEYEEK